MVFYLFILWSFKCVWRWRRNRRKKMKKREKKIMCCWFTIRINGLEWSIDLFCFKMIKGLKLNKLIRSAMDHLQCWSTLYILG